MAMASEFNPEDRFCWYFGPLSREETNDILDHENIGVFLVRDSKSIKGDFVLCVREDTKTSHYIINRIQTSNSVRFRIGDQEFPDLPSLLEFYKTHYLDTTSLIRTARREKVMTKYDFAGKDEEDLPFTKGEILEIISKDEREWWTARNAQGQVGQIPVPYVVKHIAQEATSESAYRTPRIVSSGPINGSNSAPTSHFPANVTLPAKAIAILSRTPSAYDKRQLKLQIGDIVTVTHMNVNGQWEGELNGKQGIFPFTHVQFLKQDEL
ncbi:adapter molecule Crk-like [Gigantopelta aegis]|uniref:adapter molecule Crk-like n=1 Tax=Gigantopelta aegis TaxID=1735272 RepID=UPI001B887404|nr:adapter molecule Crk-like [Gigantopelta aegis]